MPSRAARICTHPGCNSLVYDGSGRCEKHKAEHEQRQKESKAQFDSKRGSSSERGYDGRWQKARLTYLRHHPLCEKCQENNLITLAVLVHHIIPISDGGDRLNPDNLMALCNKCHEEIHGKDRFKRTKEQK
jgi:5-methylcytosine-specific restriction protein A